jgi:CheY-like chemotaxis protein
VLNKSEDKIKILAVDDEELNLDIMSEYFEGEKYEVVIAHDGVEAFEKLESNQDINVIVLDRMMPKMDGIEFLKKLKSQHQYDNIPVIMQTAATAPDQVKEGIEAGAYYYLSKPYHKEILLSIVRSASTDSRRTSVLVEKINANDNALNMLMEARFEFRDLNDVTSLSTLIANCCSKDRNLLWGLTELMINAIEHGSLGISYDEKKELLISGKWHEVLEAKLKEPKNQEKKCLLKLHRREDRIEIVIEDQGQGFNWNKYLDIDPERITDPNGRGIALSRQISFDSIEYQGTGNIVKCIVMTK